METYFAVFIVFFCIFAGLAGILIISVNYDAIIESAVNEEVSRWEKEEDER